MKQIENSNETVEKRNSLINKLNLRILMVFSLIIISFSSAVAKEYQGYYVTNDLDTIKCTFNITENIFYKGDYNFHMISQRVRLTDAEGKKYFKPQTIACFVIFLPIGECKFVSMQTDDYYFYHELATGKISMYLVYHKHPYDGGKITHCVFYKNNELTELGTMTTMRNQRKKVNLLLSDNPEVLAKWEAAEFSYEILQALIKEYNEK